MIQTFRIIWTDLKKSILVGERYERNMRGIKLVALLIVIVNFITGELNLLSGFYSAAVTSPLFIVAGLLILYFTHFRQDRKKAVITALLTVVIIFTYSTFNVSHGFTIFWTLLLPMAFCYFASVRAGILLSLYFLLLYFIVFFTPLRQTLGARYSDIIAQRFPLLYLADVILTAFIMIQYHRTTLHQMEYAKQLAEAKEAAEQAREAADHARETADHARETADRANAAKSEFLANMSHEIRTPINVVIGLNELIQQECAQTAPASAGDIPDHVRSAFRRISTYAKDVQSAGNNLLAVINDILDFSKIEANRMEITEKPYKFSSVLNDLSNLFLFRAKEKELIFTVDVDENIPDELNGDEARVRQVITNLLNNAIKYTKEGSVSLSIHPDSASLPEPGGIIRLIITVRDTGIGIRKEDLERIFNKFERVDLKQNSTIEGTGLGLAITQNLVRMMNGSILVDSVYGEGSTFTLTLPQQVVSADPVGNFRVRFEQNMLESKAHEVSFHAPQARILIVDDTRMNLTVAAGLLKSTKIRIDTAASGAEAVSLARLNAYDIILMDQRMPEMDGTEAMRLIHAQEDGASREKPVICLTADAISGARQRYLSMGFTDYLTKPIDSQALFKMLLKYLPENLVTIGSPQDIQAETDKSTVLPENTFLTLHEAGVDTQTGLGYCQQDEFLYRTVLQEYAQSATQKASDLRLYYEKNDWKNYTILVHAVKSTSRMIGAEELARMAAALEDAASREDTVYIHRSHDAMMQAYGSLAKALTSYLGIKDQAASEEDILEFPPQEEILEFPPQEEILEFPPREDIPESSLQEDILVFPPGEDTT